MAFLYCFSGRRIEGLAEEGSREAEEGSREAEEGSREAAEVGTEVAFLMRGVRGMTGPVSGVRTRWFVRRDGGGVVGVVKEDEGEEEKAELREDWLVKLSPSGGTGLFLPGGSISLTDSSYSAGVKTSHTNPTNRPLEHSCRNAISSQNCSRLLTLRHCPEPRFDGDSVTWLAGTASRSSSSNSSKKRVFVSSGKCGTRHLGGAAEPKIDISRKGCPCFQRVRRLGSDRMWVGRKADIESSPGMVTKASAVGGGEGEFGGEDRERRGSRTRSHHFIN